MARLIVEGSASLSSEKVFNMTNAQALISVDIFISDTAGPMPEGLTTAQQNQWRLDRTVEKLTTYLKSEVERLSRRKRQQQRASTEDAEIAIETNF
jgi:hypothetical protein